MTEPEDIGERARLRRLGITESGNLEDQVTAPPDAFIPDYHEKFTFRMQEDNSSLESSAAVQDAYAGFRLSLDIPSPDTNFMYLQIDVEGNEEPDPGSILIFNLTYPSFTNRRIKITALIRCVGPNTPQELRIDAGGSGSGINNAGGSTEDKQVAFTGEPSATFEGTGHLPENTTWIFDATYDPSNATWWSLNPGRVRPGGEVSGIYKGSADEDRT